MPNKSTSKQELEGWEHWLCSINGVDNSLREKVAQMTKKGCVFYFNKLHTVKKNDRLFPSEAKGWPVIVTEHLYGPPKDEFSGKLTFVNYL